MISFALQNYYTHQPFLIKTVRYGLLIKFLSTSMFTLFFKINIMYGLYGSKTLFKMGTAPYLSYFFNHRVYKPFWIFMKKFVFLKFGLYTSNLSFSFVYHTLADLCTSFGALSNFTKPCSANSPEDLAFVALPIRILTLSFHKKSFDTIIFFLITLLLEFYWTSINTFQFTYSFIFFKNNFNLLFYWNRYYLKLRHF